MREGLTTGSMVDNNFLMYEARTTRVLEKKNGKVDHRYRTRLYRDIKSFYSKIGVGSRAAWLT